MVFSVVIDIVFLLLFPTDAAYNAAFVETSDPERRVETKDKFCHEFRTHALFMSLTPSLTVNV
jgi:hypothetical protein